MLRFNPLARRILWYDIVSRGCNSSEKSAGASALARSNDHAEGPVRSRWAVFSKHVLRLPTPSPSSPPPPCLPHVNNIIMLGGTSLTKLPEASQGMNRTEQDYGLAAV